MIVLRELNMQPWQMQRVRVYEIFDEGRLGIGVIYNIDLVNKKALINVFMDDMKNRIQAREAIVLLLEVVFDEMNFEKTEFYHLENDTDRMKILGNLRFTLDGCLRNHFWEEGKYQTVIVLSMLRHEYERFFHNEDRVKQLIYS